MMREGGGLADDEWFWLMMRGVGLGGSRSRTGGGRRGFLWRRFKGWRGRGGWMR